MATRKEVRKPTEGAKSLQDVMQKFLDVKGVEAVIIVGRDGFVIDSAGNERSSLVELDALGASLAVMVDAMESTGNELEVGNFEDMNVTYGRAVIVGVSVGDAILALVSPDAGSLGIIRYNCKKLLPELETFV